MSKGSTYTNQTPADGHRLLGTNLTPETKNYLVEAIATYVQGKNAAYAGISVSGNGTAQTGITGTPVKVTAFDTNMPSAQQTANHTGDNLTAIKEGDHEIFCQLSFSGSVGELVQAEIFKNNVATGIKFDRKLGTGGDVGSASMKGILALVNDDVIDVRVNSDGATISLTFVNAQLMMTRLGV